MLRQVAAARFVLHTNHLKYSFKYEVKRTEVHCEKEYSCAATASAKQLPVRVAGASVATYKARLVHLRLKKRIA